METADRNWAPCNRCFGSIKVGNQTCKKCNGTRRMPIISDADTRIKAKKATEYAERYRRAKGE